MESHGVVPDRCSYSSIIQILVWRRLAGQSKTLSEEDARGEDCVKAALGYVDAMKRAGLSGNIVIYNTLIKFYTKVGYLKEAEETYQLLQSSIPGSRCIFFKLLGRFEEVTQIAKQMRDLGLLTDLLSYNNVLGLYALDGRFKAAVGNFKEVVEASVQPDDCTFKSLGIVLVKCGISKKAVGKLEATTKNNYQKGL
ncbi:hypothetical protein OIU85_008620 [Salix viminalis]|uniref:Pentacotripeptide-repeat region of PRORP domain-containing protein n=1 Tax=Salix viminalis TaxID=40686 RepID=A0A9Q0NY10_SALVM|nr:hypothetical protein OIU85_008620 [Salix viminalis]